MFKKYSYLGFTMTENFTNDIRRLGFNIRYRVKKKIFSGKSRFQKIDIYDLEEFGKTLFLDDDLNICESDSHIYDKAMIDPIFMISEHNEAIDKMTKDDSAISKPEKSVKRVLILGGGDGGVLREVLTHSVEEAIMVEIDKDVIDSCKKHLPKISNSAFEDRRTKLIIGDATGIIKEYKNLDAIVSDLTDPEIIAREFGRDFYNKLFSDISSALKDGGVLSLQVGSFYEKDMVEFIREVLEKYFKEVNFRQVFIPSY